MKKFAVVAGLASALMLTTSAFATDLEVIHWWTSPGESRAVGEFAKAFDNDGAGDHWVDNAIALGETARAAIMQRVLGGNPPGAAQFNPGRQYEELIKNNLLLDLTPLAEKEGWEKIIRPATISDPCHVDGKWWCVPVNIHSNNWAWVSPAAFKTASLDVPKTWDEYIADLPKLKAAGIIPFAAGGDGGGWQLVSAFGVIQTQDLGQADRDKLLKDKDQTVAMGDKQKKAFADFRVLSQFSDEGEPNRNWNDTTALVIQGKAALQIMGDWARGEFGAAGKKPDVDYVCWALPADHPLVTTSGDVIVFPKQGNADVEAAQLRLASLLLSPAVQANFNNAKGSMPVRDDVDMSLADPCMLKGLSIIKDPANIQIDSNRWLNPDTQSAFNDLISQFWNDDSMTVDEAQQKYADILKAAT
ncbi:MAG TPA: ABC transporter substrate-binding protein [Devosiaceae bacterium]